MATQIEYNADREAEQRKRGTITIGGHEFHPVKRNNKLMKALIELSPEDDKLDEDKPMTKEESLQSLAILYDQLEVLLEDGEGSPPARELLEEELDIVDARAIVRKTSPNFADDDPVKKD